MMNIADCSSCVQAVPGRPPSPWTALLAAALLRRAATAGCLRLGGSRACRRGHIHSGTGCTGSLTVWGPQSRLASSTSGPLSSATPLPHPRNVPPAHMQPPPHACTDVTAPHCGRRHRACAARHPGAPRTPPAAPGSARAPPPARAPAAHGGGQGAGPSRAAGTPP